MREKDQDHVLVLRRMFRYVLIALLGFLWFSAVLIIQYIFISLSLPLATFINVLITINYFCHCLCFTADL